MFCKKCGAQMPDTASFCPKCGCVTSSKPLTSASSVPPSAFSNPAPAKKINLKLIIILIAAVLIMVCVTFVVVINVRYNSKLTEVEGSYELYEVWVGSGAYRTESAKGKAGYEEVGIGEMIVEKDGSGLEISYKDVDGTIRLDGKSFFQKLNSDRFIWDSNEIDVDASENIIEKAELYSVNNIRITFESDNVPIELYYRKT